MSNQTQINEPAINYEGKSKRFDEALSFAREAHRGSCRKGTNIPYITHPIEAAEIAITMTSDEDVIIAALLHDVVEDTDHSLDEIRMKFGSRVADIVAAETEDKREDLPAADTWLLRKEETLKELEHASREARIVCVCDKLSNIRSLAKAYEEVGDRLWDRFNQKDPAMHKWYYMGIKDRLAELSEYDAYVEYAGLCEKVFGE